ncbi:hypothetical protein B1218_36880 [Pseudomonas ogarae]|nr:hypothetical protein B1218_36880 [Pseudomonas ogarae]
MEGPGITRAWSRRRYLGPGTVGLFVLRDDDPQPVPHAAQLGAVRPYTEPLRPPTSESPRPPPAPPPLPLLAPLTLSRPSTQTRAPCQSPLAGPPHAPAPARPPPATAWWGNNAC